MTFGRRRRKVGINLVSMSTTGSVLEVLVKRLLALSAMRQDTINPVVQAQNDNSRRQVGCQWCRGEWTRTVRVTNSGSRSPSSQSIPVSKEDQLYSNSPSASVSLHLFVHFAMLCDEIFWVWCLTVFVAKITKKIVLK